MTFPSIDPVFLRLGPLEFRWYGLMYILGFAAAYFLILDASRRKQLPLSKDDVADLVFSVALGIVIGGRTGYILFYNLSYYLSHPLKLFAVWEGGMSFHGGLIGGIVAGYWFGRKKGLGFWQLADLGFLPAPVGLGLGRLGNFINGELFGRTTDLPWGIVFPGGGPFPRHPSQLYEAVLEGGVLFVILRSLSNRRHPDGAIFWTFIAGYGLFRFIVEFFREPDPQIGFIIGTLSMGQLLCLIMMLIGASLLAWRLKSQPS